MGYRAGDTVIVSHEEVNHVGVVLDKYIIGKQTVYDVLLESRLALIMLNTSSSRRTYIDKTLTAKLCDTGLIEVTIPYKEMLANETLPICHA
jgi:hypothetical protein